MLISPRTVMSRLASTAAPKVAIRVLAVAATGLAVACSSPAPPAPTPTAAPTPTSAPTPDPGLPGRLVADVTGDGAFRHLEELQRIADANNGNRALGTPGYDASVEYVARTLRDAGYAVETPEFTARSFSVQDVRLTVDGASTAATAISFSPATPAGGITAPLAVLAQDETSGCEATDFAGVPAGTVVLVRRGTCPFGVKSTNAAAAKAAANAAAALAGRDRATAALEEAEDAARTAEASLAATQSALVDQLGEGDPAALLDQRQAELRDADAAARAAAERERTARDALDTARRAAADATARVAAVRERLATAWGALGEESPDAELDEAAARIRRSLEDRAQAASEERTAAAEAADDVGRRRAGALEAAGLEPDADLGAVLTQAEVRAAEAAERVHGIERTLEAGADLGERLDAARTDLALSQRLRDDLQPSRFLAWLLGEERAALAELASVHLEALTDGDFRFTEDETFHIVDVNAGGTVRAPDSLSGGETFLASLALALALAEMVTRGGSRLDSFFLDEGFGSLDPEHIELAMRGVEHLVTGADRLVMLVSHVEQMHALIEDLIVLDKDDATASSRVVSGARLAASDGRGTT